MRHRLLIVLFVFTSFTALAGTPTLTLDDANGRTALALSRVDVHVLVRGHLARTTFDLTWRNDLDRVVGGSFVFPLPKGADVSDVALWFGDHLRHAVAVERVLAKAAYVETVHRRVDPALAEWSSGRAFRLHVYPIPAHGTKSVHIAYDEDLAASPYTLDLRYGAELASYDVTIEADDDARVEAEGTALTRSRGTWTAHGTNLNAAVHVTRAADERALVARSVEDGMWYASAPVAVQTESRPVAPAPNVVILWDASGSTAGRDDAHLLDFIDAFVARQRPEARVTLVPFHIDVEPARDVDRAALRFTLSHVDAAGATNLIAALDAVSHLPADARVLLVTDGIASLGDSARLERTIQSIRRPVTVINPSASSDEHVLNAIAHHSGGWYVDLNDLAPDAAVESAMREPFRTAIEPAWPAIRDLTTSPSNVVNARSHQAIVAFPIVVAGRRRELPVREIDDADLVRRAWARARLHEMLDAGAPAADILAHGRLFNQITPRTSLLILESWRDYEAYGVPMPPDVAAEKPKEGTFAVHGLARTNAPPPEGAQWFITGTVSYDAAPVPGVTVTFRPNRGSEIVRITDVRGQYTIGLPSAPQSFTLRAELIGFNPVRRDFPNGVASGTIIDLTLRAAVTEAITVTAAAPAISVSRAVSGVSLAAIAAPPRRSLEKDVVSMPMAVTDRETLRRLIANMNAYTSAADRFAAYASARQSASGDKWFYATAALSMHDLDVPLGVRVASDLAEAWPDDAPLLRVVGRLLDGWGRPDLARLLYERALEIAPGEPQTWRELLLLDRREGRDDDAAHLVRRLHATNIDSRHSQTQVVLTEDIQHTAAEADLQIEAMWDSDFSDVDLHVVEPGGEEVWYSHLTSRSGGRLHDDITTGFGPEIYTTARTMPGEYRVALVYYRGDRTEANEATLVHVRTLGRGGRSDYLVILDNDKQRVEVATVK